MTSASHYEEIYPISQLFPIQTDLENTVQKMTPPIFAVIDGGHFNNIVESLLYYGLSPQSLFIKQADYQINRFGPWFLPIRQKKDIRSILNVTNSLPAVVFWSCPDGTDVLYAHLRRLNVTRIPAWAAADKEGPTSDDDQDQRFEGVLFRHWDPNVLGALLPVLDNSQRSRILGPAKEIAFDTPDYGGIKWGFVSAEWPVAPNGPLVVRSEQMLALRERRVRASHRRIADYLCQAFPEAAPQTPDAELMVFVQEADKTGRSLGIQTETGHKRWAYLIMASSGSVLRTPGALRFIQHEGYSPDDQVRVMIDLIANKLRASSGS